MCFFMQHKRLWERIEIYLDPHELGSQQIQDSGNDLNEIAYVHTCNVHMMERFQTTALHLTWRRVSTEINRRMMDVYL